MSIGRICSRTVATAGPKEAARALARRMGENNVGTLVVVGKDKKPVGIVTDRDLAVRVLAGGLDSEETTAEDIMTDDLRTLDESTPIDEALGSMRNGGIRRIVVTGEGGTLAGILSLDDVLELLVEEVEDIGEVLRKERPSGALAG